MQQDTIHTWHNSEVCYLENDHVKDGSLAVFVSSVIVNWKMFYSINSVWQLKKLKSNWKYISLIVKYPTHTRKIFYTIILLQIISTPPKNSSPHSHQAQAKRQRELSPVKPRSNPRPTTPPPCLQAPPLVKVVFHLRHLHPISLTHPIHPSFSPDFVQL